MKMTKIESARIIAESTGNPVCWSILCSKCFNSRKGKTCKDGNLVAIEKAKAYIKRHESKSKKKDHILDTTKKVEEPKPIKTVGIDNSDITLAQHEPTPLEIAKMIRDNGYSCIYKNFDDCRVCPFIKLGCGHSNPEHIESFNIRKKLIDDYISANELVKDCPVNSEYPQPIKLPDFVYSANKFGVSFVETGNMTFTTNEKGELLLNGNPCFATPEEALQVAKKLWNGEGK